MKTKRILSILFIAFIGGLSSLGISSLINSNKSDSSELGNSNQNVYKFTGNSGVNSGSVDFTTAAEISVNAVVHVKTKMTKTGNQPTMYDFFFGNPYGNMNRMPMETSGSGVILSSDGYIVTNNHVVENADEIEVVLNDNSSFTAELIGRDPSTDIALLKIDAKELPVLSYGNSDELKVGEWVLAVGNPFNLMSTVTAGIVSAKGRNINLLDINSAIESFIQTDAAVNPGNSGGALVNIKGELVGINTAIASMTGSYSGYSFAIPVSIVKKVVADLMEYGTVQRALLGVSIQDIDSKLASELKINKIEGVYVMGVNDGSAAKDAGIKEKDIILDINKVKVNKVSELQEQISKHRPGDKISVLVKRGNDIKELVVTLKNNMGTTSFVNKETASVLGANLQVVSDDEKSKLKITNGVKIVELMPGKLLRAGVQKDFIIVEINNSKINGVEDVQDILNKTHGGVYIKGVYPDGTIAYYAFGLE
jgi:Do/DeqQ family serine protease